MGEIRIFLASSTKLVDERRDLQNFALQLNNDFSDLRRLGIPFNLDFQMSKNDILPQPVATASSQSEIDESIRNCDYLFVVIKGEAGPVTVHEFMEGWKQNVKSEFVRDSGFNLQSPLKCPEITVFFICQDVEEQNPSASYFKKFLRGIGYYYSVDGSIEKIKDKLHRIVERNLKDSIEDLMLKLPNSNQYTSETLIPNETLIPKDTGGDETLIPKGTDVVQNFRKPDIV